MPSRFPRALGWLLLIPLGVLLGIGLGLSDRRSSLGMGGSITIAVTMFGAAAVFLLVSRWRADAHYDRLRTANPGALILEARKSDRTVVALSRLRGAQPFSVGESYFLLVDEEGLSVHSRRRVDPLLLGWERIGALTPGFVRIGGRAAAGLVVEVDPPGVGLPVAVRATHFLSGVRTSPSSARIEGVRNEIEAVRRRLRAADDLPTHGCPERLRELDPTAPRLLPGPSVAALRSAGLRLRTAGVIVIVAFLLLVVTGVSREAATPVALPTTLVVTGVLLLTAGLTILQFVPFRVAREYEAGYTTTSDGSTDVDHLDPRTGAILRPAGLRAATEEQPGA